MFYAQATIAVISGQYLLETPYLCTSLMSSGSILVKKFGQETNGHGTHRWDEEDLYLLSLNSHTLWNCLDALHVK